jgi:hypothetical protein
MGLGWMSMMAMLVRVPTSSCYIWVVKHVLPRVSFQFSQFSESFRLGSIVLLITFAIKVVFFILCVVGVVQLRDTIK